MIPKDAFRPIILLALMGVFIYTWRKKELGLNERKGERSRRTYLVAIGSGFTIGFYDGVFGPGTGSFLMLVLVALLVFAFLEASVTAKLVNLATNLGAILAFGISGKIIWSLGFAMSIGNIIGGVIGARLALRGGSKFIRRVFLTVTSLLILRLTIDTFF